MADDEIINAEVVSRLDSRYAKTDGSNVEPAVAIVLKAADGGLWRLDVRSNGNLRTTQI